MIHPGLSKAIQVKVELTKENDTKRVPPRDEELRKRCLEYYEAFYKRMLPGLSEMNEKPVE